ncbi:hypothetical protein IWQ56_000099 [Coemansia nantahalensis]|nr:hypothetical protein IWQ56_000099 [Coemansia nantahalensis]
MYQQDHVGPDAAGADSASAPERPTYIAIHARDESTQMLYISSGCHQGLEFTPEDVVRQTAKNFITEQYDSADYASLYASNSAGSNSAESVDGEEDENDASVYAMYLNLKKGSGTSVLTRVTSFKCDNCVICVNMAYPEAPISHQRELQVQMLDGAMKSLNVTRENDMRLARRRQSAQEQGNRAPLYFARSRQTKVAFVLENPEVVGKEMAATSGYQAGPRVVFVTGSVTRLIDVNTCDVMQEPFLQLVAPEDIVHVTRFFERLASSADVLFENFSLLSRPHMIDGDIVISDTDNERVLVECLGAAAQDGIVLLLRKRRTVPAPRRDTMGNYIRSRVHEVDDEQGYISLAELVSSDPETSDAPEAWSRLSRGASIPP